MYINQALLQKKIEEAGLRLEFHDCVESTNNLAKERGAEGEPEGLVIISRVQTGGKGRLGRSFLSEGNGLYMTLLLRPKLPISEALKVTTAAAVSISEAVEKLSGIPTGIKWVNDVYTDAGKICGILCESALVPGSGRMSYIVCGMGINVEEPNGGFPENLPLAGSLYPAGNAPEGFAEALAAKVCASLLSYIRSYEDEYLTNSESVGTRLYEAYKKRCMMFGKRIFVIPHPDRPNEGQNAIAVDLDYDYHLLAEYDDGSREWLQSGDVSLRLAD